MIWLAIGLGLGFIGSFWALQYHDWASPTDRVTWLDVALLITWVITLLGQLFVLSAVFGFHYSGHKFSWSAFGSAFSVVLLETLGGIAVGNACIPNLASRKRRQRAQ